MKLTEIVTALENKRQTVQNAIDALKVLISLEAEPQPGTVLPPPVAVLPQLSEKTVRLKRTPKAAKAVRKPKSSGAAKTCGKHPGFERDKQDRCKQCARDYAREWAQKKKAAKSSSSIAERRPAEMRATTPALRTTPPGQEGQSTSPLTPLSPKLRKIAEANRPKVEAPSPKRRRTPEAFTGDEIEYSKPITCPKCHAIGTRFSRSEEFNRDTDSWTCLKNGCQVRIAHVVLSVDHAYEPDAA